MGSGRLRWDSGLVRAWAGALDSSGGGELECGGRRPEELLLFPSQPGRRFSPWPPEGALKVVRPASSLLPLAPALHPAASLHPACSNVL